MDASQQGPVGDTGTDSEQHPQGGPGSQPSLPRVQVLWLQESKLGSTQHRQPHLNDFWSLIIKNCP